MIWTRPEVQYEYYAQAAYYNPRSGIEIVRDYTKGAFWYRCEAFGRDIPAVEK